MKCDLCENEATVHEQTIRAGKVTSRHLCESCARDAGISVQSHAPLTALLSQFITTAAGAAQQPGVAPAPAVPGQCPMCGLTFAKFKETGLLGCPDCYQAFEQPLSSLLQRAHEGGTHHRGKKPKRAPVSQPTASQPSAAPADPSAGPVLVQRSKQAEASQPAVPSAADHQKKIASLKRALVEAIKAEKYEKAAEIRDQLRRLGDGDGPSGGGGGRRGGGVGGGGGGGGGTA